MRSENGIEVDQEALNDLLRRADVITIGFPLSEERLLVDLRSNADHGQLAALVQPVASVQERYLWLGRHRGALGAPLAFSFFVWPKSVRLLVESHALARLIERLEGDAIDQIQQALGQALEIEERAMLDAVMGAEDWPALWDRHARGRSERGLP